MRNFIVKVIFTTTLLVLAFPQLALAQQSSNHSSLTITNLNSISYTISWFTDKKMNESIHYGTNPQNLNNVLDDDRGAGEERLTHHITLRGLLPATDYYFRISDNKLGPIDLDLPTIYKQKTAPRIRAVAPLPELFQGNIINEDNGIPQEGIVYMKINRAELLSSPIKPDGSYELRTLNIRSQDLNTLYQVLDTDTVNFFINAGIEGYASKRIFAYGRDNAIDFRLVESRIPFYRMKLLDGIIPEEVASSSSSATSSAAVAQLQSTTSQGFFQTIWARLKDIF